MNTLILDDEYSAIQAIRNSVEWNRIGIEQVYSAETISQAKEVMQENSVGILLSDVELKNENAFELIKWVKENYPMTQIILITSHASFLYANQAIEQGILHYILKPVDSARLEECVKNALEKSIKNQNDVNSVHKAELWSKHKWMVENHFWEMLISRKEKMQPEEIERLKDEFEIDTQVTKAQLIYIHLYEWNSEFDESDVEKLFSEIHIMLTDLFLRERTGTLMQLDEHHLLVVVYDEISQETMNARCRRFISSLNIYYCCTLNMYYTDICALEDVPVQVEALKKQDNDNKCESNQAFRYQQKGEGTEHQALLKPMDTQVWTAKLKADGVDGIEKEAKNFFRQLRDRKDVSEKYLVHFKQDFSQLVYSYLTENRMQARDIFHDSSDSRLFDNAVTSVGSMEKWVFRCLERMKEYTPAKPEQDPVQKAMAYIRDNLGTELTREQVSDYVYLNPDYFTKVFKKETGYTITEYITNERMKEAAALLRKTELSVTVIANQVGYTNISHFSKAFRNVIGVSPKEYRKKAL